MNLLCASLLIVFGAVAVSAGCPAGGVWSEWVTGPCPTTCGSYTNVTRTRTCTKRCGDCPCVGPDSDIGPCGIAMCPFEYKLTQTCMDPYVKSLNYDTKKFFCGTVNVPAIVCP